MMRKRLPHIEERAEEPKLQNQNVAPLPSSAMHLRSSLDGGSHERVGEAGAEIELQNI